MTPVAAYLLHRQAAGRPAHRFETVEELGSILVFAGRPQPNHAGDKFIFFQYRTIASRTNDTWGLYVQDVSSGKKRMVDEFWICRTRTFGWSPDDRFYAYARNGLCDVVICNVDEGKPVAVISTKTEFLSGAWLTPEKLVCSDGEQIFEFVQSGGRWHGPQNFASTNGGLKEIQPEGRKIEYLQAFSSHSLLWKQGNAIMKSSSTVEESPLLAWQTPTNELVDFFCSRQSEKILVLGRDKKTDFLTVLGNQGATDQYVSAYQERLDTKNFRATQVRLINKDRGYAYLGESDFSLNQVGYKMGMESGDAPSFVPLQGEIKSFEVSEQQLFLFGSLSDEPVGIWKYDLIKGELKQLASNQQRPFQYALSQTPVKNVTTNAAGKPLTYYLLEAIRPREGNRPPLVLGAMGYAEKTYYWDRYAQTIANCGAGFVMVDRRDRPDSEWADDLLAVYHALNRRNEFDTNNVYLFGISKGAICMNELLETKPALWRGAIFMSPGSLPETSCLNSKKLYMDIGGMDPTWGANSIRAKTYQDQAAKAGADMSLFIRPNVGHNSRLLSVEKERLHQLAAFLDDAD